jgi:histidyl-tRNA synthetase
MKISKINQEHLERLKKIIETEESREVSTDQALTRVLGFYKQFVPYN